MTGSEGMLSEQTEHVNIVNLEARSTSSYSVESAVVGLSELAPADCAAVARKGAMRFL